MTWIKKLQYVDATFDYGSVFDEAVFDDSISPSPFTKSTVIVDEDWFLSPWFTSSWFMGFGDWTKKGKVSTTWSPI